ncbi:uncharacterized protein KZ484_012063 [Pholidichthys leucotaenia]
MFSSQRLRELVRERLAAAAAEEIITEFELITNQYEEEIDRQRRLLNMRWCSQIKIHRLDFSQQPECKAEEVVAEQQLWNQERNSVLDHEEPEAPQVKEEQEELCISQEGEQLVVKLEADPFMGTLVCEEKQQSEAEPNSEQLLSHSSAGTETQDEEGSRHVASGSTKEEEEPKPKKRRLKTGSHRNSDDDSMTSETLCENETGVPQLHDCKEEEVLTVQQLCKQERNSSLDQEEQDAAQVKEEEEELCSSQEEEAFGLKQETDTFMVTPADEDNDKSETEANSEQLLSHNSADTESQDQGAEITEHGSGYTFYCSGCLIDEARQSGVSFAIKTCYINLLDSLPPGFSDRLMMLRLKLDTGYITCISAYASTMIHTDESNERFYEELDRVIQATPHTDKVVVLGDFNARVGASWTTWENVIGHHGVGKENSNGTLLLNLCAQHQLSITNTFFQQANKLKSTWMHPRSGHWHQIDFVIT